MANRETQADTVSVNGRANLFATELLVVGRTGTFESKSVNFRSDYAELNVEGTLQLVGNNSARSAAMRSTGNILDAFGTQLHIDVNVNFEAPAVYLADHVDDKLSICGHANFNVTEFASIHVNGDVTLAAWRVFGADSWINPDSRVC